jgi:hypothetical protein
MDTTTKDVEARASIFEALEREYRERKAEIRADETLSWEKKELAVRQLGLEYDQARKEAERSAA